MSAMTYGRLDEVLRTLNFSVETDAKRGRFYTHAETGALIALPVFPDEMELLPRHVLAARSILEAYEIAQPFEFEMKLHEANEQV